ncbi:MAG: hypothetical protein WKF58_07845 [Ilumatobacteraceae bacterium]
MRYVEQWLALHQRLDRVPGVQLAILHGDDIVSSRAFGVADLTSGEPLTTERPFPHRARTRRRSRRRRSTRWRTTASCGSTIASPPW